MSILDNLLLWASIIWIAPIIVHQYKNEIKVKKGLVLGVTLTPEAQIDHDVLNVIDRFRKQMNICNIVLLAFAIPCLFIKDFTISLSIWCSWTLLVIFIPGYFYALSNSALKKIKKEKGYQLSDNDSSKIKIETREIQDLKPVSIVCFLIPLLISITPLLFDKEMVIVYLIDSSCIIFFYLSYRYIYRTKNDRVSNISALNETLGRVRYARWSELWIISSYLMAGINVMIALSNDHPLLTFAIMIPLLVIVTAIMIDIEFKTRRLQEKLTANKDITVDEDDHWIFGMFYYNENDSRLFVANRIGLNMTVNLAKKAGKVFGSLSLVLLLSIPFIIPVTMKITNKEPILINSETAITAICGRSEYTIQTDEIKNITLLEELPNKLNRINGTGLPNLLKGRFRCELADRIYVSLDPTVSPFILIETIDGTFYLFGSRDQSTTLGIYKDLAK